MSSTRPTAVAARRSRELLVALHAEGGAGLVFVGTPAGLVALGVGLRAKGWSIDVGAFGAPRSRVRSVSTRSFAADVSLWTARVSGCGVPAVGRFELPICGMAWLGTVFASGVGPVESRRASYPWAALGVTGGFRVSLTRALWLSLWAGPVFVLNRPQFAIDDIGVVCCTQTVGGLVEGGLEVRLGRRETRSK